jgi:hypothetical protein
MEVDSVIPGETCDTVVDILTHSRPDASPEQIDNAQLFVICTMHSAAAESHRAYVPKYLLPLLRLTFFSFLIPQTKSDTWILCSIFWGKFRGILE